jgi:hypothetical protein
MWCPIQPSDARHLGDTLGDTEGDTHGDSVSPSRIPHLACKFSSKYRAIEDRSATRINPDLPLGAPPLGLPISPSVPDSIFRRFNVPSQIAPHHHGFQPDGCRRFIGGTLWAAHIPYSCASGLRLSGREKFPAVPPIVASRQTNDRSANASRLSCGDFKLLAIADFQGLQIGILSFSIFSISPVFRCLVSTQASRKRFGYTFRSTASQARATLHIPTLDGADFLS